MIRATALALALLAAPAAAQVSQAPGALLRGLDKIDGTVRDFSVEVGEAVSFGRVEITLGQCRYPSQNPAGNAFAWLTIRQGGERLFEGWMIAASPALNALDHPRYDVWVMRCTTA